MAKHHLRPLYYFSSPPGVSDFSSKQFSGGVTGSHRTPQGSKSSPSYLQRVDSIESHRPNRRFSVTLPFTYFCDSQENRGPSGDFDSEENQCFHFGTTFPYGNSQCHSTESAHSRLGSLVRFEGRLPSRTGTPSVQEIAGFQIPRQDLCVEGLAFRPKRLSVGLFEGSSYGNSSPSPAGHPDILLSGRLAARRRVPVAPPVPPSCHSSVGPEFGVHRQSEEIGAHPSEDARLPRSLSRYPQVDRTSGGAQSGGSTVAHPGTYRVSDGSCSPVAESSRPFGQLRGSGSKLQASHATSSVALPSILLPPVGFSVETDYADSRNQGSVCSLGVSGSASRREAFLSPPPPLPSSDLRCLPVWLGRNSPASPGFRHLVQGGVLGPYQLSRTQGSVSGPEVSRSSCHWSVSSDSFGQHNSRVLYQLPGRNSLPLSLSSGNRALGVVYSEGNLSAAHIPGEDHLVADFLSRGKFLPSEWTLNPLIFQKICQVLVPRPEIDLFASTLNFQLPKYCARCRDPHAWKVDALSFRWSGLPLYAFPPF